MKAYTDGAAAICLTPRARVRGAGWRTPWETKMSIGTILLIVLVLVLIGAIPAWPYSRSWGYGPSGVVGLVVLILVILLLMGRL